MSTTDTTTHCVYIQQILACIHFVVEHWVHNKAHLVKLVQNTVYMRFFYEPSHDGVKREVTSWCGGNSWDSKHVLGLLKRSASRLTGAEPTILTDMPKVSTSVPRKADIYGSMRNGESGREGRIPLGSSLTKIDQDSSRNEPRKTLMSPA